jgi:hypothetical protein
MWVVFQLLGVFASFYSLPSTILIVGKNFHCCFLDPSSVYLYKTSKYEFLYTFWRFFHIVAGSASSFCNQLYVFYFIELVSTEEPLSCFQSFTIINKTTKNNFGIHFIHVHIYMFICM